MVKLSYSSPLGNLVLIAHRGALVYCNWDSQDCLSKQLYIEKSLDNEHYYNDRFVLEESSRQLDEYFSGKRREFNLPLRLADTDFREKVWSNLRKIACGETISYKQLAQMCGSPNGYRCVANACGLNPIAIIIPCHRVVASNGKVGGYTGGVDKKKILLHLENEGLKP